METESSAFLCEFTNYYSVMSGEDEVVVPQQCSSNCAAMSPGNVCWCNGSCSQTSDEEVFLSQDYFADFPEVPASAEGALNTITIQGLDSTESVYTLNTDLNSLSGMSSEVTTDPGTLVMDLDNLTDSCPFDWDLNLENLITTQSEATLPDLSPICNEICGGGYLDHSTDYSPDQQSLDVSTDDDPSKPTFQCSYGQCRKVYAKAAHLRSHIRRHLGHKPYVCTWKDCSWRFNRSDELARHRRSHSGDKNYNCDYCPKRFTRSDHLSKHRKVHERKIASGKVKGVWRVLPKAKPGRKPKVPVIVN